MKSWLFNSLNWILPERMVRTLFISSLYSKLFKVKTLDIRVYQRINEILCICQNDYALGIGMQMASVLWNGEKLDQLKTEINNKGDLVLTKEAEEIIANKIISQTPQWLCYNRADMVMDIRRVIENRMALPKDVYI